MDPAVARNDAEAARLSALRDLCLLDTGPEPHLDAVCRTARRLFGVPIALIPLVDETRLWFKARCGVEVDAVDRAGAFCDATIRNRPLQALVVHDLLADPRFAHGPLVTGAPRARFYAGMPFASGSGHNIGTLCLIDTVPRPDFDEAAVLRLRDLARIVEAHMRLHESRRALQAELAERRRVEDLLAQREARLAQVQESQSIAERTACFGHWRLNVADQTIAWSDGIARIFGREAPAEPIPVETHVGYYHPEDRERVRGRIAAASGGRSGERGNAAGDAAGNAGYDHRSRVLRPDGSVRHVVVHGIAAHDAAGDVTAFHGVCLDVTDLAQSEQRQRETSDLLRTTLENMDQGILMLGPDARVRIHNRRARDLLELPEDLLYDGAPFDAIRRHQIANGEFARTSERMRRWVDDGALETAPLTHERQRPNGAFLEVRSQPMAGGGVVRTFTDVTRRRGTERAVQESEARYRLLADSASDMVVRRSVADVRTYVSPAAREILGFTPEEMLALPLSETIHPDDVERNAALSLALRTGRCDRGQIIHRNRHKDGHWVWVEARSRLVRDAAGAPVEVITAVRDITERVTIEEALRASEARLTASEERLAHALDSGSDGLWDWNLVTGETWFSERWYRMLGYEVGELDAHQDTWLRIAHHEDAARAEDLMRDHIKGLTPHYECEYRLRRKDGTLVWVLVRGKVVDRDAAGRARRVVGTQIDITRRKEAERQVAHLAVHDALTGLPNRLLFRDRLDYGLASAQRQGGSFAVLACDLDRFKAVNDSHGHPNGDLLLRTIAERLSAVVRAGDTVARLGGDEFAIILDSSDGPQTASATAQRVIEAVGRPVILDGHSVVIGVSVGIAFGPKDGADADTLFKNADIALYRAKANGKNQFNFYESGMDEQIASRTRLEADLRAAIRDGGFELHYQPILDIAGGKADGTTGGFEALLRWRHPTRGAVPPGEFIPLAEETGLIVPLGEWALREACREAAGWPDGLRVAVNVSAVQFQQSGLELAVVGALAASGLAPHRLELEITESVLLKDAEAALGSLYRLRALGLRIALDDFGTGYSSLSYLRRFPFDKIKIDRAFIREIGDPDAAVIVRAIVAIGAQLGMGITAEGVETREQLDRVRGEGCTEVQGFLYSPPLPAAEARAFVRAPPRRAVA